MNIYPQHFYHGFDGKRGYVDQKQIEADRAKPSAARRF